MLASHSVSQGTRSTSCGYAAVDAVDSDAGVDVDGGDDVGAAVGVGVDVDVGVDSDVGADGLSSVFG